MNNISIEIDIQKNPWILNIDEDIRDQYCNQLLNIGYMVSNMCNTTINEEYFIKPIQQTMEKKFNDIESSFIRPLQDNMERKLNDIENRNNLNISVLNTKVNENLDRFKNSLDKFTEFSHKSSLKGAIGENIIETVIQQYFPDDTLINTSKKTAESDYQMRCHNGLNFLIESKFYTNVIQKNELEKFRRDLIQLGFPIGIFISLTSGIVGKKRFDVEKLNDHQIIIYLPNAGLDGGSIIWSILFAKELIKYVIENKIERDFDDIHELYDSFQEIYHNFTILKLQIFDTRNHVIKHMDELYHKTIEVHLKIQNLISDMKNKIQQHLFLLGNLQNKDIDIGIEDSLQKMQLENDENNYLIYQKLYEYCKELDIKINVDETNNYLWYGFFGNNEIFRTKVLTKKKEIIIQKYKITMSLSFENIDLMKKMDLV